MPKPHISASTIISALREKHAKDVFVDECKDGPTWSGSHLRLDAWAMVKSWANPVTLGYEVKVSRSDFVNDNKWTGYLPLCNQLYFCCPRDLIKPDELPAEVGLMYLTSTGNRLLTKKKAAHREVQVPESLYRYILMSRSKIVRDNQRVEPNREYWESWLKERTEDRNLGYLVKSAIKDTWAKTKDENRRLKEENASLQSVKDELKRLGVESRFGHTPGVWDLRQRFEEFKKIVPVGFLNQLNMFGAQIAEMRKSFEAVEKMYAQQMVNELPRAV